MTPDSKDRLRRIESRQNARVKELRRAFAEAAPNQQGEVAVEGMHLVEEAIRSGLRLSTVFFSESARERAHRLLPQLSAQTEALLLPDSVFASAVPSETPQGVAALVRVKSFTLDNILAAQPALLVITAGLQDPGNLGTIARSAEAFGVTGLLLGERTVSPWNWKAVRASAGSLFRLPTAKVELANALPAIKASRRARSGYFIAQGNGNFRCGLARPGRHSSWAAKAAGVPERCVGASGRSGCHPAIVQSGVAERGHRRVDPALRGGAAENGLISPLRSQSARRRKARIGCLHSAQEFW